MHFKLNIITNIMFNRYDQSTPSAVCCHENFYYDPDGKACEACPNGTKSYYDGLFCGKC